MSSNKTWIGPSSVLYWLITKTLKIKLQLCRLQPAGVRWYRVCRVVYNCIGKMQNHTITSLSNIKKLTVCNVISHLASRNTSAKGLLNNGCSIFYFSNIKQGRPMMWKWCDTQTRKLKNRILSWIMFLLPRVLCMNSIVHEICFTNCPWYGVNYHMSAKLGERAGEWKWININQSRIIY